MKKADLFIDCKDHLGEGILWSKSNQTLYYMLEWESLADREKKWDAFQNDEEWLRKRAETEKNGTLVASVSNSILQPTSFSSVK